MLRSDDDFYTPLRVEPTLLSATEGEVGNGEVVDVTMEIVPPRSQPPPHSLLSQSQLVEQIELLHAEATRRGLLLQPRELQARMGVSAVGLSTMPTDCSHCGEAGRWSDTVIPKGLVCCHGCLTAVHRRCSFLEEATLAEHGWECDDCHDPMRFLTFPDAPACPVPTTSRQESLAKMRDAELALQFGWRDFKTKINQNREREASTSTTTTYY